MCVCVCGGWAVFWVVDLVVGAKGGAQRASHNKNNPHYTHATAENNNKDSHFLRLRLLVLLVERRALRLQLGGLALQRRLLVGGARALSNGRRREGAGGRGRERGRAQVGALRASSK